MGKMGEEDTRVSNELEHTIRTCRLGNVDLYTELVVSFPARNHAEVYRPIRASLNMDRIKLTRRRYFARVFWKGRHLFRKPLLKSTLPTEIHHRPDFSLTRNCTGETIPRFSRFFSRLEASSKLSEKDRSLAISFLYRKTSSKSFVIFPIHSSTFQHARVFFFAIFYWLSRKLLTLFPIYLSVDSVDWRAV